MCGLSFAVALVLACVTGSAADELCADPSDIVSRDDVVVTPREGTVDVGSYTFKGPATPRNNARAQVELRNSQPFTRLALDITFDNAKEIRIHLVAFSDEGKHKKDEFHNVTGRDSLSLRWDSVTIPLTRMVVNAEPEDNGKDVMLQIDGLSVCKQHLEPTIPTALTTESSQQEYDGQCMDGWLEHGGNCYGFVETLMSWPDAASVCGAHDGELAEINDAETNEFLKNHVKAKPKAEWWIGGDDLFSDGDFTWASMTEEFKKFTDWDEGEPNNLREEEHCLHLRSAAAYKWNDAPCELARAFICARKK